MYVENLCLLFGTLKLNYINILSSTQSTILLLGKLYHLFTCYYSLMLQAFSMLLTINISVLCKVEYCFPFRYCL